MISLVTSFFCTHLRGLTREEIFLLGGYCEFFFHVEEMFFFLLKKWFAFYVFEDISLQKGGVASLI